MWSVVFISALMCGASLGSPLKFEIPHEFRPDSPLDSPVPEYRRPIVTTPARPLVEMLETPELRARLVEMIEQLFEDTKLPCTGNLRTTLFVALLHLEGNLAAVETGLFKERAVEPLLEELDPVTRTKVVDAIHMVSKELLEKPITEGLVSDKKKRNEYVEAILVVLRRVETVIRRREMFTFTDLELLMRPLLTSLAKVRDCSLLISRQQVLDVCQRICTRMITPGPLETSLRTLEHTLTTIIRDPTTATYMRDMLETLTTKYVSLMTYTLNSLTTLLRSDVRPTAILVDWMYCLTMMPTSRTETPEYTKYPIGRMFQEFPTTWKYPHTTFLASNMVPPLTPLAHLIVIVYRKPYPVHESFIPIQTLKESVWSEVREFSLPKPTESCYPQRVAAYNSVLVMLLNMVDRRMLNTTCFELVNELYRSDALPYHMETSRKWALWQEVLRLKTELLRPQTVAVDALLEVPELHTILRSSNILEFIDSPREIPFPVLISTIKKTLRLVTTSPALCHVEVHDINRRVGHALTIIGSSLNWETVEMKLTEGLLNFGEMHRLTIPKTSLYKVIGNLKPVIEMFANHKLSIADEVLTCFLEERVIPDVLANLLITMKIKIADLETSLTPPSVLPREMSITNINIAFTEMPIHKDYPMYDLHMLKEAVWSKVHELNLPSPTESCYPQKLAVYNSVLVVLLNVVDRMMLNATCTHVMKELSYSDELPLHMEEALLQELLRLKTELLLPQTLAVETLLEVPELNGILRSSNLLELMYSLHTITIPTVISTFKNALNLIKTMDSLCWVEVHSIDRRLKHALTTIKSSLTWETVTLKLTEGLLDFCNIHNLAISNPYMYKVISNIRPDFEAYATHKLSIINDLWTCVHEGRLIPDVLANLLITMKIKIADLTKFHTLPISALPIDMILPDLNIPFMKISTHRNYPVHDVQRLKQAIWSEVRELSLPTPIDSCYPQRLAAYNSVLAVLLNMVDRMVLNTTCTHIMKELSYSNAIPLYMEEALLQEVLRLKTELLLPQTVAVETLLEVPELNTLLRSTNLLELIYSPHSITFPWVISTFKNALNLIKSTDSLCDVQVHGINRRIEHVLGTIRSSLTWEAVKFKVAGGLLNFCNMHKLAISKSGLHKVISNIRPVFEAYITQKLSIVNKLWTCVHEERLIPDVLANLLITMKIKIADLTKLHTLPTSVLHDGMILPHLNIPFMKFPTHRNYPMHDFQSLKNTIWSEVRELSLPTPIDSCYPQKLAAYNSVLTVLLNLVDRMMLNTTCTHLMKEISYNNDLPPYMEKALLEEILRLKTELLLPQALAVETLLEVPELNAILRSSNLVELIYSPHAFTFPRVISTVKNALNLIKTTDSLCWVEAPSINHNLEHALTTIKSSLSWEGLKIKLTEGLLNFCDIHKLVISTPDVYKVIASLRPAFEMYATDKLVTIDSLSTCVHEERIIPDMLVDLLTTMKIKLLHMQSLPITLPTGNVFPSMAHLSKVSTKSVRYFSEGKLEDLPGVRMLSFPAHTDPCFMQKLTAINTVLVQLLNGADRKAMVSTLGEILTSSEFSFTQTNPHILRSAISILSTEFFLPESNAIQTYLEIPELHNILKASDVLRLIKTHDFTFRDIWTALQTDLYLIRDCKSLCTMDVTRVASILETVLRKMERRVSMGMVESRLLALLRTNFKNTIPESQIYQIVNTITPVLEVVNRRRASLINEIRTCIRREAIPTEVVSHVLHTLKRIGEFRMASRPEFIIPYSPMSPVMGYNKALLYEVRTMSIPLPMEPCYSQKVAAYHAVLVKLLQGLNHTIIEKALHHFMELPAAKRLLSSVEERSYPSMIAVTLKKELWSQIEAIKPLFEVPEVRRLLAESELVPLVTSRMEPTFPAVLAALKKDLKVIRNSDYLCTAHVHTVLLNAEHYLTTLKTLFSWETMEHKLINGLRRTCEKIGLVHDISDYKMIVSTLRPVFERLTVPYTSTVEAWMTTVRHERINPDVLYHTLVTVHELLAPTPQVIAMGSYKTI